MEGGGSARQGDGMRHADQIREFALERVDVRTKRGDPVGIERVEEQSAFLRAGVRRRKIRALAHFSHVVVIPHGSSRSFPPANRPAPMSSLLTCP